MTNSGKFQRRVLGRRHGKDSRRGARGRRSVESPLRPRRQRSTAAPWLRASCNRKVSSTCLRSTAATPGRSWRRCAITAIKLIHMRHEQSCAYAADGWARTTATPGVCSVTAGCGLTNAVTGLCAAGLAGSAVVCIAGQHPTTEDGLGSFQEAYGSEVCRSFSKFAKRVLDWSTIEIDLRQAFRDATSRAAGRRSRRDPDKHSLPGWT